MGRGSIISAVLHLAIALIAVLGVPDFLKPEPIIEDTPIIIEMVDISDITNLPQARPAPKAEAKAEPEPPKPEPPPPAPPEPPKPEPAAPPPPAPPEPPKPEPKPEPAPEPEPVPEPAPKPKPKPETPKTPAVKPPPPTPKLPDRKKAEPDPLSQLLKSVDQLKKDQPPPTPKADPTAAKPEQTAQVDEQAFLNKVAGAVGSSNKPFIPDAKLSISEIDAIRAQIERCWNVPVGAPNPEELVVAIKIWMNPDGVVRDARIVDTARMGSDPFFRSMAESALRAVRVCSPLTAPKDKYDVWKEITMNFNPAAMVGR